MVGSGAAHQVECRCQRDAEITNHWGKLAVQVKRSLRTLPALVQGPWQGARLEAMEQRNCVTGKVPEVRYASLEGFASVS